jgi:rare lipoprotein A
VSGQDGARHRASEDEVVSRGRWFARRGVVAAVAAVAVVLAIVAGVTAVSLLGSDLEPSTTGVAAADAARDDAERAGRNNMRDTGSFSPSQATSSSAGSTPSRTTSRSPKSSASTGGGGGGSGTCGVSFYATGSTTANGERFDPDGLTAAHKTLPFNTRIRVTNPSNGKSVVVRVNDRGPFVGGRCIDLARGAFAQIASLSSGVITARYEVLR